MSTNHFGPAALLERFAEGLVSLTPQGICTYANRQIENFLRKHPEDLKGKVLWEEVPALLQTQLPELCRLAMSEQMPKAYEQSDECSGRWFAIRLFPAPDGITIHFADITEQKLQEAELRESAQVYSRLLNTLGGIVWVAEGKSFRFLFVSEQAEKILGYPVKQWLEEPDFWRKHTHPDDVERCARFCNEATSRGEDHAFEYRMIAADGRAIWFRDIVTVEYDENREVRLRGIMLEITEQKRIARQHEKLWHDLQERVKEFAALSNAAYVLQHSDWSLETVLRELVGLLPPAFQFPEVAAARVKIAGTEATTPNFREMPDVLRSECRCASGAPCSVEVVYLEKQPRARLGPFLAEEQLLLHSIADMLRLAYDRRFAQKTLERREEQFRTMVENAWDCIIIVSRTGALLYQSPSLERMVGYAPEQLRGPEPLALVCPEEETRVASFLEEVFAKGDTPTRVDFRCRHSDGTWRIIEAIGRRVPDEHGEPVALLNARDVTERREMERQLREDEARFRRVFEGSGVGMTIADMDYRFVEANEAFCSFVGYSREELLRMTVPDVTFPEDWALTERAGAQGAGDRKHVAEFEKRYIRKDGAIVWGRLTIVYLRDQGPEFCVGVIQDITARKKAEEALRRKDRFYRSLIEHSTDNMAVLNAQGVTQFQSAAVETQLGYSPQELIGRNNFEIIHPEDRPKAIELFTNIINRDEISPPFELRCRHKNGSWRVLECIGTRFIDEDGEIVLIVNSRDVTDRRVADELLQRAKQQAEAANLAKDRFLAALSHELRTPLTPVVALLPALLRAPGVPEDVRSDLSMIKQNVELETRLIDDLLDLTHITRGKVQLRQENVDAHRLVENCLQIVRGDAEVKRIAIHLDLKATQHHLWADPVRMQQVFWNVLKNAIKFSQEGKSIWVSTENPRPGSFEVVVKDQGIGIEPEQLPRVFDAFVQTSSGAGHQFGGLGLGLYISRAIVELHGGTLQAESEGRGKGATFRVSLFNVSPDAAAIPESPAPRRAGLKMPLRILLVEDHAETREVLARLLRRQGHTVLPAYGVREALEVVKRTPVDIAISDLGLPDGSGVDLMVQLKKNYGLKGIAVSGYGMESDFERTRQAGFGAHLVKPIDFGQLQTTLQEVATGGDGNGA